MNVAPEEIEDETVGAKPSAIRVSNLTVTVGSRHERRDLIHHLSMDVPAGGFVAVVGASGCGKSTLIKTLAGLTAPSTGAVHFSGHPVNDLIREFPLAIGYLPQFGAFHADITVEENLRTAVSLRLPATVAPNVREHWLQSIIALSGLEQLLRQPYKTLSGGQMRRMALAEQLVGDPAFLLLDELTSGLDEFSDRELMVWLRDLAHAHGKTIILVTHSTYHLRFCDSVLFLHRGRRVQFASYERLLLDNGVNSMADLFEMYDGAEFDEESFPPTPEPRSEPLSPQPLRTARPPHAVEQLPTLVVRHLQLFWRDRSQLWLHLALAVTFPALVAVFAMSGLPQVRQMTLGLESNIVNTLADQLLYLKESFKASALVSGLAMFQTVLLTLVGANNGAREIAKERDIFAKELRAGLSPLSYLVVKFGQMALLCLVQAFWMAWFVKTLCGFPGSLLAQFAILYATVAAMSATCLAISAAASTPERASLLAIYLVGFQLPLSGAALALPDWISTFCRPLIAAYWGWSGYLKTLAETRHYDVVKQATSTHIASYSTSILVLTAHCVAAFAIAWLCLRRKASAP